MLNLTQVEVGVELGKEKIQPTLPMEIPTQDLRQLVCSYELKNPKIHNILYLNPKIDIVSFMV